jgi:replication factor A1
LGDSAEIPTLTYNFVDIANIEGVEANATIDVIGVVKRRGELQTLTQSTTGKELKKRDLFIVDRTNREINLTLWGKQAEDFNDDSQPVIAAKGVKVSDFSGKSLSALSSSSIQLNPDIRESHILRGWFDNEGVNAESSSLSIQVGGRGGSAGTPWKLLREANWNEQADPEKGDFFMSKVTVMSIKRENSAYQACPTPTCNKKVINLDNGLFRCEKCNREFPDFKWRLMVSVNFADYSDHLWATCFQEASEALLGQPASILGPMSKDSAEEFDAVVKDCVFNSYIVKFRSKMDTFNNETRMRVTVMDLHKLNFTEYSAKLIAEIKETA